MKIDAEFVTSAADAHDLPHDLPQIALVGRSNVGKSRLINALARRTIARTSATPGKTRLANVYRVRRWSSFYLVDLPGFGYARGRAEDFRGLATQVVERIDAAVLVVDARHPGLDNDRRAWRWLQDTVAGSDRLAVAANKIDKLSRAERLRAKRELEAVFDHPVTVVSADTGEGLEELWKQIERLANSSNR